ncbi:hypothetical protein CB1_000758001 [Camelus ferus]|nr:hypothetical protein CB1_000758001 [Camelus ferus]
MLIFVAEKPSDTMSAMGPVEQRVGIVRPGLSEDYVQPPPSQHLKDMEERLAEAVANVDDGTLGELGQNGEEKSLPNANHIPKIHQTQKL